MPVMEKLQKLQQSNFGLGELHAREIDLILKIRNVYRFGEITLITSDGLPKQVLKTISRDLMSDVYPQDGVTT